jgi:hypothetical protein
VVLFPPYVLCICGAGGGYVVSPNAMWLVMACPFSPRVNIIFDFMGTFDFPLMLVTLHHDVHL